jgi:putative DNA primase/helicase
MSKPWSADEYERSVLEEAERVSPKRKRKAQRHEQQADPFANIPPAESADDFGFETPRGKANGGEREEGTAASRATIRIVKGQIARMTDEAEAALIAAANVAPILVRAGMLVQPIVDQLPAARGRMTDITLLRRLSAANLVYLLNKHAATFARYDVRSDDWVAVDPPPAIAVQLLEKGQWKFPKVAGVITTPTLRPDGTILDKPGYDPATQLWYAPDSHLAMPPLIESPTRKQAEHALAVLDDLLVNFPFEAAVDRAVALAAMLTAVLRGAFDVTPMSLFRAPDIGTGKSFLADLISTIARGQPCPVITASKSVEEMEKRLGALVLEGVPMISLDNCSGNIGGDLLCQITERRLIRIRILGKSEAPECEWRGMLFGTGNNVTLLGDMTRRGLVANLDAKVERPELREFSFDPIERVLADRGTYIAAAITVARAYIAAGGPKVCDTLGSYGGWTRIARSPLVWLGKDDPVKSMEKIREEDPARRAVNNLISIWREHLTLGVGYTAADIAGRAAERLPPELYELLLQQAGTPRGDIDARRVGMWLASICGRIHDGCHIERVQGTKHGNRYALKGGT